MSWRRPAPRWNAGCRSWRRENPPRLHRSSAESGRRRRLARERSAEPVDQGSQRAQAGSRLLRYRQGDRSLSPLIDRLGDSLVERADLIGVELDRRDAQAAGAELDVPRARVAERDSDTLEVEQVRNRVGERPEAVVELLAQRAKLP